MLHRRVAALAAVLATAVPALAAGAAAPAEATTASGTSTNWAGYAVSRPGVRFRTATASWVQPAVTCTSSTPRFAAMWIGLGGYHTTSRALEQIGTDADCLSGSPHYTAWYELVPAASVGIRMTVRPGDRLSAAVRVAGHRVTLTLRNRTRGTAFSRTFHPSLVDLTSAEWIVEAPAMCTGNANSSCRIMPLADFGTATFTSAHTTSTAGHVGTIADARWQANAIDLAGDQQVADRQGAVSGGSATTGALSATGSAFAVSFADGAAAGTATSPWTAPASDVAPPAR